LDWASGWDRTPAWDIPGWYEFALANWPDEVKDQIQIVNAVDADPVRTASVIRQVVNRELQIAGAKHANGLIGITDPILDYGWSQNFAACANFGGFRRECAYVRCCFSPNCSRDPLSNGFEWRAPNHPVEREA
jgi:hypothetical protein